MISWIKKKYQRYRLGKFIQTHGGIPRDLDHAVRNLHIIISDADKKAIVEGIRFATSGHFGIGMWIRNNWGLWSGGPLAHWFYERGIWHADDMSAIVLTAFECDLKGTVLDLPSLVKSYMEYWERSGLDNKKELEKVMSRLKK